MQKWALLNPKTSFPLELLVLSDDYLLLFCIFSRLKVTLTFSLELFCLHRRNSWCSLEMKRQT